MAQLRTDLVYKTYTHGPYAAFTVADPKPRNIHKATVRDRVVHHLIYHVLSPYFNSRFIHDSYSCRVDKGTHRALDRFRDFARIVSRNHTRTCYVLKGDIKNFFASIDHGVLMEILKRHVVDSDIRWLIGSVLASFCTTAPGVGLPLGNLTSQLFANVYLHELDRYLKQELRVKHYIRYADDFVVLSTDRRYLGDLLPKIRVLLIETLHLTLHENKVYIQTYGSGVDFLGWVHFPHHRQIRTTTKRKVVRALTCYPTRETVNSYRGLLGHGNTYQLQKRLHIEEFCE